MRRFTLVELMIVVAIISVLAAIAVPNFTQMQLRTKRSEILTVSTGMEAALVAYLGTPDGEAVPLASGALSPIIPPLPVSKSKRAFTPIGLVATVGFRPDGQVYGSYVYKVSDVFTAVGACGGVAVFPIPVATLPYTVGVTDVDGNGACGKGYARHPSDSGARSEIVGSHY